MMRRCVMCRFGVGNALAAGLILRGKAKACALGHEPRLCMETPPDHRWKEYRRVCRDFKQRRTRRAIDEAVAKKYAAAISRKDAALHRCVDAMRGAQSQNWIGSANWKAWEDIIAFAKAALEET